MLQVGDSAPEFQVKDNLNRDVQLSDYKEKTIVLWFYPEADTPN